jgi:hypothetical protein
MEYTRVGKAQQNKLRFRANQFRWPVLLINYKSTRRVRQHGRHDLEKSLVPVTV